jgi:hypothetical protein
MVSQGPQMMKITIHTRQTVYARAVLAALENGGDEVKRSSNLARLDSSTDHCTARGRAVRDSESFFCSHTRTHRTRRNSLVTLFTFLCFPRRAPLLLSMSINECRPFRGRQAPPRPRTLWVYISYHSKLYHEVRVHYLLLGSVAARSSASALAKLTLGISDEDASVLVKAGARFYGCANYCADSAAL